MGALVHFNHGEGKRISLHYSVTDLISSGKRSRSLSQLRPLTSRQKGGGCLLPVHCCVVLVTRVY